MKPLKIRRKRLFIALSMVAIIVFLFFGGRYFVYRLIRNSLHDRVDALRKDGVYISFDSVDLDPWNGHIYIKDLKVILGKDSMHADIEASSRLLHIKGVEILPFLLEKTLTIRDIALYQPNIIYRDKSKLKGSKNQMALDGIKINHINLAKASVVFKDSTATDTTSLLVMDVDIRKLAFRKEGDSLAWNKADLVVSNLKISAPKSFYSYSILKARLNLEEKIFTIDSLKIIPVYDKKVFARTANEQVSRLVATVPHINITGLEVWRDNQMHIDAKKIAVDFTLDVYRDKRYPFLKRTYAELPIQFIQKLSFQLQVDSISVINSFVRYEEFPEKGDSTGYIFFDKINSSIVKVHNRASEEKTDEIKMFTSAKFMGKGDLDVIFTYPADTTKPYTTTGVLKNFPMTTINSILVPAAKVRVESGTMRSLNFNFAYNRYTSNGSVALNYTDLRVVSLHEDENHQQAISGMKSFLINTLVLKKDIDEKSKDDRLKGTIQFNRDPRRAIFHYWWQSVFSGVKSAYGLDKLLSPKKDIQKDVKKEKRKEKKLKRKQEKVKKA
ncbi:MAG TPA: hypothetical protein VIT44_09770 [Cyclobacteriaceae bacterium]